VGCVVWDAALVLCSYLETADFSQGKSFINKSVCDLGSGTGAVGLVAAALGGQVILTDLPEFLPLMQRNIDDNKSVITGSCSAKPLTWGENAQIQSIKDLLPARGLDFLTIADCVYYDGAVSSLVDTVVQLCGESTTVLCCYEERLDGNKPQLQKQFFHLISEHFSVTEVPLTSQDPHYRSEDIHIFKFNLKKLK